MSHIITADKLKRVLYKFSDLNYKVSGGDDIYLQKLVSLLTNSDNTKSAGGQALARLPLCVEWLGHVADTRKDSSLHPALASFALRLAGVVAADSRKFMSLQNSEVLNRLLSCLEPQIGCSGSVALAYVFLLSELLQHDDGCCWIIESGVWRRVIKLSMESKCIQVCRESQEFIGKLVVKIQLKEDSDKCEKIMNYILEPLEVVKSNSEGKVLEDEEKCTVFDSVSLVCSVLETAVAETGMAVMLDLLENRELELLMWQVLKLTDDEACIRRISKIMILLYFLLCSRRYCADSPMSRNICLKAKIFDLLSYLIGKGYVKNILYVCFQCKVCFHRFSIKDLKFIDKSKLYELEDQLVCFQIMPVLCLFNKMNCNDIFLWQFTQKLFDISSEETVRLAYPLKEVLFSDYEKISEYSKCAISYVLQLKSYLDKGRAATVCQALAYALKSFVVTQPEDYMEKYFDVLPAILDGLSALVDHFQISWRESVESICLFSFVEELLKKPSLLPSVSVKALRLMQVAVRNYLPPNLALLVNTMGGSSIQELGPLLLRRMHDTSWDVRDSALELLHTVTDMSHLNFPPFQEHIMENGLCAVTVALAMDDEESYVRTSALKCLGTMVRVQRYWDNCLSSQDLPGKMISILTKESEGMVRRDAALLMKEIYHHQTIPKSIEGEVFATMVSAATRDLYWEVKINSLCFWEKVIEQQMSHQGMIDGRFPSVTFSKENRKIVTLTEDEVKLRINKALEELGRLGCLQVLLSALDDCDLQVVYKAVAITTSLSSLLSRYGILHTGSETSRGYSNVMQHVNDATPPQNGDLREPSEDGVVPDSDQVIENILDESDASLLAQVCCGQTKVSASPRCETGMPVKAQDFLSTLATINLQDLVSERSQWIDNCGESLSCLLDDILFTHGDHENVTDCY